MKRLCVAAAVLMAALSQADAQTPPNEAAIRAGGYVAVTMCIACHIVSPNQSVKPVLGPGIPSFAEIANRRDVTVDGLRASMKIARWHDPGIAATLLPMPIRWARSSRA